MAETASGLPEPSTDDVALLAGLDVGELGRLLRVRVPDLVAYQDRRYARRYVDAVNARDLEGILSVFSDDAEVEDPVFKRSFKGKDALREFYEGVITRAQLEITGPVRGSYGNVVATPIKARIPGMEIDVITLTSFNDDGLVQHYAAYWGPTDLHPVKDAQAES